MSVEMDTQSVVSVEPSSSSQLQLVLKDAERQRDMMQLVAPPAVVSQIPTWPAKRKLQVLEEEEYCERLDAVIQKEFFPDLPRLKAQYALMEAIATDDPDAIRKARRSLLRHCTPGHTPARTPGSSFGNTPLGNTPLGRGGFDTPRSMRSSAPPSPAPSHRSASGEPNAKRPRDSPTDAQNKELPSLDAFLNTYTSEDNDSFEQILDTTNAKQKLKHAWIQEHEKLEANRMMLRLTGQDDINLMSCTYTTTNQMMFHLEGVPFSPDEVKVGATKKEILRNNTRFTAKIEDEDPAKRSAESQVKYHMLGAKDPAQTLNAMRNARQPSHYDLDDFFNTPGRAPAVPPSPAVRGYGFVCTPSPAPGAEDDTPVITWGSVEGAPLLLDPWDTPADGPALSFTIKELPKRDQQGLDLVQKIQARKAALTPRRTPVHTPSRPGSQTPNLSAAGQRLARTKASPADSQLRASYRSPAIRAGTARPPVPRFPAASPSATPTHKPANAAISTPSSSSSSRPPSASPRTSLTDNLLL
eukprot:gnl/Hemi2/11466_TR3966_c0_g20_i1.p1 gnl/Hemi2/11466_TR3966_c0_g20~~gnl/Hemi2/11466_TR3966_c0_g20_i1.p1  ORF type:complete len:527 (+),score=129.79 gnl/Hemi2/11466_TR3966_c0_g20_i1:161-1741(+)